MTDREALRVSAYMFSAARYGRLRITRVKGPVEKCTNVVWFDLDNDFSNRKRLGSFGGKKRERFFFV